MLNKKDFYNRYGLPVGFQEAKENRERRLSGEIETEPSEAEITAYFLFCAKELSEFAIPKKGLENDA